MTVRYVRDRQSVREGIYTLLAIKADQKREVLGIVCHPSESSQGWREVFGKLKDRRVREIGLVIADGLSGIEDAVASHCSGVSHQLCLVHLKRLDYCKTTLNIPVRALKQKILGILQRSSVV